MLRLRYLWFFVNSAPSIHYMHFFSYVRNSIKTGGKLMKIGKGYIKKQEMRTTTNLAEDFPSFASATTDHLNVCILGDNLKLILYCLIWHALHVYCHILQSL